MPNPFNFNLSERTKLILVVVSIFLVSLSLGMLVFGTNDPFSGALNAEILHQSKEVLPLLK